ncbi:response regulator transcription factor [Thermoflexus sp.]|uniref:response regulator transcription factor n=1 Tax=Thermoflexus sp. TaxID=1969742 RepID=UPI0025CFDE79|nr:response regulator transcription factor [Thermoflexus sp.]MDW8179532.1 response regulator transcription factor [Anaerolineae bacterium]MCS6962788.1 response regulator transcription factor [Thermoflexus sp.]MCS7350083.1 response regulator transcription factor [Thermoflexus sp.]MCX7689447.1 response regulator transcription factor [Thermoflexus sp.]MDW8184736.1 response regulator transcription factor [Anaerolineae bacterium]
MGGRILLIDDDDLLRRSLAFSLEQAGFEVHTAASAEEGLAIAARERPDVVLLDIGLPGMDGLEALRRFREILGLPVIFLTARRRELDEVVGLELGADDYITKPFDTDVLIARIRAVLRRLRSSSAAASPAPSPLAVGDLVIDPAARMVTVAGRSVSLTPKEFDLLYTLALAPNRVLPTETLLTQVWGAEYAGQSETLYVHIRWLREKIEEDPEHPRRIVTVRGVGYKLVPQG